MYPEKIRRGYYRVHIIPVTDNPASMPSHEITERHVKILEEIICKSLRFGFGRIAGGNIQKHIADCVSFYKIPILHRYDKDPSGNTILDLLPFSQGVYLVAPSFSVCFC
jgi:hypothetical protein